MLFLLMAPPAPPAESTPPSPAAPPRAVMVNDAGYVVRYESPPAVPSNPAFGAVLAAPPAPPCPTTIIISSVASKNEKGKMKRP